MGPGDRGTTGASWISAPSHQAVTIMKRETGSFVATDDQGRRHTIRIYTEFLDYVDPDEPGSEMKNVVTLLSENNERVEWIGKGKFQTRSGVCLHSDDPAAQEPPPLFSL
jgi:hypothetical protein